MPEPKKVIGRARTYESDRADNDTGLVAPHEAARISTVRRAAAKGQREGMRHIVKRTKSGY